MILECGIITLYTEQGNAYLFGIPINYQLATILQLSEHIFALFGIMFLMMIFWDFIATRRDP